MAFPVSPTNGQTAVVNNITYQFSNVGNTWTRILSTANIITANTLVSNGYISAAGNVTGNYILGNGSQLTGISINPSNIASGTSNVSIVSAGGNATVNIGGTSNVAVFATTGEYVTGVLSASGNITGGNLLTAGSISATGTLSVSGNTTVANVSAGNISAGSLSTSGLISATANITGGNVNTSALRPTSGGLTISTVAGNLNLSPTTGNIVVNSTYINGVSDPVQNQDVATKAYVDNFATTAITYHQAVTAATTANLATTTGGTITYTQPNGASNGVGALLTTTGSFNLIDTANVQTLGTRILVKNEGNSVFNGVYTWANATNIVRSTDTDEYGANSASQISINDYFFVTSGNVNAGSAYIVDAPSGTITFGTSNITFAQFSSSQTYTANTSAGITLVGTVISAKVDGTTTAFDGSGNISVKASANLTTPNIGAATGTSLSTTANVTGGNLLTGGLVSAAGTITGSSHLGSVVSVTANVTGGNVLTGGLISATSTITSAANITGGNLTTAGQLVSTVATGTAPFSVASTTVVANLRANVSEYSNITGVSSGSTWYPVFVSGYGNGVNNLNMALAGLSFNVITGQLSTTIISASGNVIGGNVLTGGLISSTGNSTAANYLTSGLVTATGNITGGNILTAGILTATGNIISVANVIGGNLTTTGVVTATGNVTGGNLLTSGLISATGNITGGNANITGTTASTSKTTGALVVAGGIGVSGTTYTNRSVTQGAYGNVILNEFTGIYTQKDTGTALMQTTTNALSAGIGVQVTGAVGNGSQLYSTGTMDIKVGVAVRSEDTPTGGTVIASVSSTGLTVTGLVSATGNVTGGNIITAGQISATGNITGNYYIGNGAFLTGLSAGTADKIANGATNINIPVASGNIAMSVAGQSNTVVINLGSLTMYGTFAGPKTLSANVSVANAVNGLLLGPVSIADGYNITVPDASTLYVYAP